MNKIVGMILVCIYLFFVVILTLYLFMYNRFGTSSAGGYVVFANRDIDQFNKGSLIVIKRDTNSIKIGDDILFYNVFTTKVGVMSNKVISKEKTNEKETTYGLANNRFVSSSNVLGKVNNSIEIPLLGYVFEVLSSSFGYLFFALIPTLSLFIYQVNALLKKYNF